MKPTHSNNGSEEVIELLSQDVITHNHMDDENVGFIKAEVASVLSDTSEIVNTTTTQHDSDDLPEILRNTSWHDPFYESSHDRNDIVMAFDIDRTKYDRFIVPRTLGIFFGMGIISSCLQLSDLLVILSIWLLPFMLFAGLMDCDQRSNQFRVKRTHIALTRNGVYIDIVDTPGGHNNMMRKVILYKDMKSCDIIEDYNCCRNTSNYTVVIRQSIEGSTNFCTTYKVEDLARPQQFVDVVHAMIAKSTKSTTGETPK